MHEEGERVRKACERKAAGTKKETGERGVPRASVSFGYL